MASNLSIALTIGASVASAISGVKQLGSSISSLKSESLASSKNITNLAKASVGSFQMAIAPIGAVGGAIMGISQPAIAFETAMADVKKVVDFDTPEQFKEMREDILALTRDIPMSAEEIAQIVAAGGQSNMARENLLGYATDAAKMGVAFDMAAGSAGTAMATMANVLNKPISEMAQFGDAINHLSDNANSKAADIVNVITRAGSDMRALNMAEEQSAALASTFLSMGKAPELAAQAMKGISASFQQLKAGKNEKALQKIGLTTKGFAKSMNEDAQGAITDFIERIKSLPSDMQYSFAADIFGKQYADDILLLTQNTEEYRRQLQLLQETDENGELAYIGSMQREFENQSNTTANNLRLLQNSFSEVGIAIGDAFLPVINSVVNQIKPVLIGAADWLNANQHILKMGIKVGGVLIGLWSGFFMLSSIITGGAAAVLTLLSPIGLLITALVGATYLIWKNWDWLKTKFAGLGTWFGKLWDSIRGFFSSGVGNISATIVNWSPLGLFYDAFAGVLSWFGVELPGTLTEAGRKLITGLVSGITSMFGAVSSAWDSIRGFFSSGIGNISATIVNWSPLGLFYDAFAGVLSWFGVELPGTLIEAGRSLIGSLVSGITSMFGALSSAWRSIRGFFSSGIANITATIVNWSPLGLFYDAFAGVLSWFGVELPGTLTEAGRKLITGLVSGITSMFSFAKSTIDTFGENVKNWVGDKLNPAAFVGFGKNIIDGLISGIEATWDKARKKVGELGDGVKSWFGKNLKINSPSRVFTKFGVGVVDGFTLGVDKKTPSALAQSKELANSVMSPFKTNDTEYISPVETALQNTSSQPNHTTNREQQYTIHFNPTIEVTANPDSGTNIKEQVQDGLKMSLYEFEKLFKRLSEQQKRRAYL